MTTEARTVTSLDGTRIGYRSLGAGEPVIVVGGALRGSEDYLHFARELSQSFEVHVPDRRGRGDSGPQGPGYSIEREYEDLDAVRRATGATRIFGHSYGGLVALETAKRVPELTRLAVYEPGVSVRASIPTAWLSRYAELLSAGDRRGAFAEFVRGSGQAPAVLGRLPLRYVKFVLRLAIGSDSWARMEPLLETNLAEHEEVRRLDSTVSTYEAINADVLLLGGAKSPGASRVGLEALDSTLPNATLEILPGLRHNAPDEQAPARVAERVEHFLRPS